MTGVMFFSSLSLAYSKEYTPLKELHEAREGGLHILERCASLNMAKINFAKKFKNNVVGSSYTLGEEYTALKHIALWIYEQQEVSKENAVNLFDTYTKNFQRFYEERIYHNYEETDHPYSSDNLISSDNAICSEYITVAKDHLRTSLRNALKSIAPKDN